jgi:site-specific recombinase
VGFQSGLAADAALVLLGAFVLQGLAVLHAAHYAYGLSSAWLVAPYVLVFGGFTTAIMLVVLAVSGFVDNWFSLRRWLPTRANGRP